MSVQPWFKPVADRAVLVELATAIDDDINRKVVVLDEAINQAAIPGVLETIPALVNLLVIFDPLETDHSAIEQAVRTLLPIDATSTQRHQTHTIRVCYDPELTPDLVAVAKTKQIDVDAVIDAHMGATYRVGMYGFAPGFAYLSGVDPAIQVPRKPTATRDIPKGSVMIAGSQCLITSLTMPTGWTIIGRSPNEIITHQPDKPFLFDVGDHVRFERIERNQLPENLQRP